MAKKNVCDRCGRPLGRSPRLIEGHVTLYCRECGRLRLEGDGRWIDAGPGFQARLRARADELQALSRRETDLERRHREMLESPDDDPRWMTWHHP